MERHGLAPQSLPAAAGVVFVESQHRFRIALVQPGFCDTEIEPHTQCPGKPPGLFGLVEHARITIGPR